MPASLHNETDVNTGLVLVLSSNPFPKRRVDRWLSRSFTNIYFYAPYELIKDTVYLNSDSFYIPQVSFIL